jgi:excinuclease UvrABC nuclease subunit
VKLGQTFLDSVPHGPGIYRIYDSESCFIYVGKAKNLRRRIGQYKNAKRRKKHRKMRKILESAARIDFEVCKSELDAELLETQLIQSFRPKWNVVGAFFFLYPMIGMKMTENTTFFCYTTQPDLFEDFSFFGAFRSREITGEAFFSLMRLLNYIAHRVPQKKSKSAPPLPKYSYIYGFRQLSSDWVSHCSEFWKGTSNYVLENLIMDLVENAGARKNAEEVQSQINDLSRFWRHEATPLLRAREGASHPEYPVSQKDRDLIFLKYRHSQKFL